MDRNQFSPTPIDTLQGQEAEQKAKQPYGDGDKVFHKFDEGWNKFRIYPCHPDSPKNTFTQFRSQVFLQVEVEDTNDLGQKIKADS